MPTRVGKKKKKGPDAVNKLPPVYPTMRCKLKMLKQERIKDYLILEEGAPIIAHAPLRMGLIIPTLQNSLRIKRD